MSKTNIAKALVAFVLVAAIFATGLYFGRTGGPGDFTVTTQYAVGAVEEAELEALAEGLAAGGARETGHRGAGEAQRADRAQEASPAADGRININSAEAGELTSLPGVGPAIAERIIAHRETHGPFRIIEDITDVSGIGPARFADIRDMITVE